MEDRLIVTASPHIREASTTRGLMGNVVIALLPAVLAAGLIFGVQAIVLVAVTTLACVAFEYLYTLPLEISRARGRAGAVPYFNVAAVPGHYGACLSDDKPPGTDGYCLGGHSAGGIQHISRICDAARV